MNNFRFPYWGYPYIPHLNEEPPTLYSLMWQIVNFDNPNPVKNKDLALHSRSTIFDFDYPLSTNVSRETFELMILNKFMFRRIEADTLTAFQIKLNVKLNEIMPKYNMQFDMMTGWDVFNDGKTGKRIVDDKRFVDTVGNMIAKDTNDTTTGLNGTSTRKTENISDRRESELPQSEIDNVKDASYLTQYNLNTDNANGTDTETSTGTSESETNRSEDRIDNRTEKGNMIEMYEENEINKIDTYIKFMDNVNNIYTDIFNDLMVLFYSVAD